MSTQLQTIARRILPLYLTYDPKRMTDGFGAQGIRITGIFSIARFFRLGYLHNPVSNLSDIDELVGTPERHSEFQHILAQLNEYISFPQDKFPPQKIHYFSVYNLGFRQLLNFGVKALILRKVTILEVCLPFGITDRLPIISHYGRNVWKRSFKSTYQNNYKQRLVVMHIRSSEHSPDKKRPQLGPIYYRKALNYLSERFNDEFKLRVHTDFHASDFRANEKSNRVLAFESFLRECGDRPNSEVNHYADIREVMFDMTKADVLVMSRSALPYLAGLLSNGEVIFPKCHGHSPLRGWFTRDCEDFISGI